MAQPAAGYDGQGFALRGEKDRFVLPPDFRKAFAEQGDDGLLCVIKDKNYPCLMGFGLSRRDGFEDLLDREEEKALRLGKDFDRVERGMELYGFQRVAFDKSGRFTLKDHIYKLGNFTDAIYFQASGQFITMWDPETLYAVDGFEAAKENCRAMEAEARAKRS